MTLPEALKAAAAAAKDGLLVEHVKCRDFETGDYVVRVVDPKSETISEAS